MKNFKTIFMLLALAFSFCFVQFPAQAKSPPVVAAKSQTVKSAVAVSRRAENTVSPNTVSTDILTIKAADSPALKSAVARLYEIKVSDNCRSGLTVAKQKLRPQLYNPPPERFAGFGSDRKARGKI